MVNRAAMTDTAMAKDIGKTIRQLRLQRNIKLEDLADSVVISQTTLRKLEKTGQGTMLNLIAVLRELDSLHLLKELFYQPQLTPYQRIKIESGIQPRQRATRQKETTAQKEQNEDLKW